MSDATAPASGAQGPYERKLTPKHMEVKNDPMTDNTVGPSLPGTEQVEAGPNARIGAVALPQVDYRNAPNTGQTPTQDGNDSPIVDQPCPSYDNPNAGGFIVPPQPDSAIRSYDLDDKAYNIMDPNQGDRYAPRPGGYSPDLPAQVAWERAPSGQTGMDGYGCQPDPQSSTP